MQANEITKVLNRPLSQELLARDVTRLAYVAKDGTPRTIPIIFAWNGSQIVMSTPKNALGNTLGLRSIMFAVDDLDATFAGLRAHGAELVGEVAQYEDSYRLCYVRGPAGVIVALAEQLG